ncbi:glycosyltransferase [Chthonomonas calidirosea]|uniref:Glycosyltransferase n=2 Tax=Chthonomonas TaxID=1077265 RepID=S0EUM7_CHTCT|nr:Glycosyltransferase [Chthonomonas calidirosea T49]CEK20458.1 glycosyltransferase [Chthonomonas calidirosea]
MPSIQKHPCRVLFIDHTAQLGGGEVALLRLTQAFDRSRVAPHVLLFSDGPLHTKLEQAQVPVELFELNTQIVDMRREASRPRSLLQPNRLGAVLSAIGRLARFLRTKPFDVVHTNSLKADLIGGFAARLAHIPLVWHVHDRIEADYLPKNTVRILRLLARTLPTFVVANSAATLQTLHLPKQKPSDVIYCGIPDDWVQPPYPPPPLCGKSQVRIGLMGRITKWKGQHIYLAAAAKVLQRYPQTQFEIIGSALFGDQPYFVELQSEVARLQLDERVVFRGFQEDTKAVLSDLDILVHASIIPEPLGQVVLEGMALGRAVVATAGGGVLEVVVPNQTGLLVPMGDAEAMAEAILCLLSDPSLAQTMGEQARHHVGEHFTMSAMAERVTAIYETVAVR